MARRKRYLKMTALLGMLFAAAIFILAIIFAFISNLMLIWILFLIVIALTEILTFFVALLFYLNPDRRVFFSGLVCLFAGLLPGLMILSYYFHFKKAIIKSYELDLKLEDRLSEHEKN